MASSKRRLSVASDESDDTSQQDDSTQSLHKRRRISTRDDDETSFQGGSDNESLNDQEMALLSQHQSQHPGQNRAAENGIIESISCTNFMCHGFFEAKLGPLMNFIIGHNGSGKSAVLTALAICLGGKASSTNRGNSLKSFIKEGQETSMLSVKIKNQGESAYQHDIFGDSIIVERHFTTSGSSAFKIKSCSGKLISNKRSDLEEICDYFALQIDNPMNVLTQDMARQFLNSSTPQDKYKFFMKGTQLEHLDNDYMLVEQTLDTIDAEVYKKQGDLQLLEEKCRLAEELFQQASQQDAMQEKLALIGLQMAWVQVEFREEELRRCEDRLQQADQGIANLENTAEGISEAFAQIEQQVETADRQVEQAQAELTPLQEEQKAAKDKLEGNKSEEKNHHTDERAIVTGLKHAQTRTQKLEEDVRDEEEHLRQQDGGRKAEGRRNLGELESQLTRTKRVVEEHELALPELQMGLTTANKEVEEAKKALSAKKFDLREAQNRLSALRHDRGQQMVNFSPNMPRLLQNIDRATGFREKPVGPIASHVRLLKPSWSSILEKQFGAALESFLVTSKEDQVKLNALMRSCDCVNNIIILPNKDRIDTRQHEPDTEFETWLRVLEIDNDLARNSLIVSQGVDQTILIEDREAALTIMGGDRLSNVKQCFTHNRNSGEGIRYGYGYGGTLSESFIPAFRGRPRMKTDIEYQINSQSRIVEEIRQQIEILESQLRQRQAEVQKRKEAISNHKAEHEQKRLEMQEAQSAVEKLQDLLEEDVVEEGRLDGLKNLLADAKEEERMHEVAHEASLAEKDKLRAEIARCQQKLDDVNEDVRKLMALVEKAEAKANQRRNDRMVRLREKNNAIDAAKEAKGQRVIREREVAEARSTVDEFKEAATAFSPRVPIPANETYDTLSRKEQKLKRDIAKSKEKLGDRQALSRAFHKAATARNHARQEIDGIEKLALLLKQTLMHRRERWKHFQRLITSRARTQFFYLLSERGFRGRLIANHKAKTLDLRVEPDETRRNGSGRSTHGLSGGEKSYSTICLLLSIWEAMGAPIRCLDEFDVFMDNVNRSISMTMMTTFARNSPGKQFVFITPNSTDKALLEARDVKISRMPDPVRGQQRLNFGGQVV